MRKKIVVDQDKKGKWTAREAKNGKIIGSYDNKRTAVRYTRKYLRKGAAIVILTKNRRIERVLNQVNVGKFSTIKAAPVKHRRSNQDVKIAIAKAVGLDKEQ